MKRIGAVLIVIGIIIVMIPVAGSLYTKHQQQKLLDEFREQLDSQLTEGTVNESVIQDNSDLNSIFNNETTVTDETDTTGIESSEETTTGASETITTAGETVKPKVIGTLQIKRLKIDVLVIGGITDADLKVGVGHFPGTADIGAIGNCAIAGHRSYAFGKFFNRLNEMEVGDKIIVSNGTEEFTYVVYKVFVVDPQDTYVLNQVEDNRILTLVTCTPIYIATQRLIVQARIEN
jgi:sortase A